MKLIITPKEKKESNCYSRGKKQIKIAHAWIISNFELSPYKMSRNQNSLVSMPDRCIMSQYNNNARCPKHETQNSGVCMTPKFF